MDWMSLMGGAASQGIGMAGDIFGTMWSNAKNASMMRENRDWMTNMANTAHQREVADLKAAGLNPILSAGGGGAATPSAPSAPTIQNPLQGLQSRVNSALMFSKQVDALQQGIDKDKSVQENNEASTALTDVQKGIADANKRVAEAGAWSAENVVNVKKANPGMWGLIDAYSPVVQQAASSARDAILSLYGVKGLVGGFGSSGPGDPGGTKLLPRVNQN